MKTVRATSRKELLDAFSFPLESLQDFEYDGTPAQYAPGHPKAWGDEDGIIEFGEKIKGGSERTHSSYYSAVSLDGKLLAISANHERILIYDIGTKELRQVLEGTGSLAFRPGLSEEEDVATASGVGIDGTQAPAYTLISSISDEAFRSGSERNRLILWDLDKCGRLFDEEEPIDPSAFATKAIDAILPDLGANHEWSKDFVDASSLHANFTKALSEVASDHRRKGHAIFQNASTGSFGSEPFSHDGKFLLYLWQNRSTQQGMREPQKLPHVVVYDLDAGAEARRLSGHTDAIMWVGFSPNDRHIASVSWDGTMRMYSATTGELTWTTANSGSQSWCAAFSPSSKHIVWSSAGGQVIQLHDVSDGKLISTFAAEFKSWCRCCAWNPDGEQIALCADKDAYVWWPFNGSTGTVAQHFSLHEPKDRRSYESIERVSWVDNGRLLALQVSDSTKLIYDTHTNTKELFKRPHGTEIGWVDDGIYGLFPGVGDDDKVFLCVDGDGKVRIWQRSTALPSSSAPKQKEGDITGPAGEGITALPEQTAAGDGAPKKEPLMSGREDWAEKGASLWTAE